MLDLLLIIVIVIGIPVFVFWFLAGLGLKWILDNNGAASCYLAALALWVVVTGILGPLQSFLVAGTVRAEIWLPAALGAAAGTGLLAYTILIRFDGHPERQTAPGVSLASVLATIGTFVLFLFSAPPPF